MNAVAAVVASLVVVIEVVVSRLWSIELKGRCKGRRDSYGKSR